MRKMVTLGDLVIELGQDSSGLLLLVDVGKLVLHHLFVREPALVLLEGHLRLVELLKGLGRFASSVELVLLFLFMFSHCINAGVLPVAKRLLVLVQGN